MTQRGGTRKTEPLNKGLPTSFWNYSNPNIANQLPVILPDLVTPVLEPDVFDGNPAYYRNFINTFTIVLDKRNSFRPN